MKKLLLICLLPLFTACNSEKSGVAEDIQLNLKKGETYTLDQMADMEMSQMIQDKDMGTNATINSVMKFKVTDVTGDVYTMDARYDRMTMKMDNQFMSMEIDTDLDSAGGNPFSSIMYDMMKSITEGTFTMKIDKNGNVQELSGISEMFGNSMKELLKKYPFINESMQEQLIDQMKSSYGETAFKSSFDSYMKIYPDAPVKVGDTWNKHVDMRSTVKGTYDVTYKLDSVTDNQYVISGTGNFASDTSGYVKSVMSEMKYDMNGTYTIKLHLDKESGWIQSGYLDQKLKGNVDVKGSEQNPDGMHMPMSMSIHSTFR